MDETTGLGERRARTIVTIVLLAEALWVFFTKYLPLDAGLWALQAELVHTHIFGHAGDAWHLIPYPASNIGAPLFAGMLASFFGGETVTRLLLTIGGIFLRGMGMLALFRVLKVRDAAIYFLIPVLAMTGLWYSGALPYLIGEMLAIWVLVWLLSQNHPRSGAFWTLSIGMLFVSLLSALAFILAAVAVIAIMLQQRKSVHLSQGWLNEPRAVISSLGLGALVLVLGLVGGEPIFRLSATGLLPQGLPRLLFLLTPAPDVLEATFRYGDILHALLELLFLLVLLGCFARAYLLAIEEVTWQSRAVKSAGYFLLVLALFGPLIEHLGIETSSGVILAVTFILAGSYSRGPAVRRTPIDRLLSTLTVITVIASLSINAFSIAAGSAAAGDVLRSARLIATGEPETVAQNEHISAIRIRFVMDSTLGARAGYVGALAYSSIVPMYLFLENDALANPAAFQPPGGMVSTKNRGSLAISPVIPLQLGSEDKYVDSTARILAALPMNAHSSNAFGPYDLSLKEDAGINIDKGEAKYRLAVGKLRAGHPVEMATRF
ncbi:MAG TPA: hypothetical protein VFD13_06920 [Candidatus Kapabacteria bacterium]|nr:hypothetical protein [Candidatus Kapabacteria bacterium]